MRLLDHLRSRLILKIGTVLLAAVGLGFSALTILTANAQAQLFASEHGRAAGLLTDAIAVGVRASMLAGDGIAVGALMADLRGRLPPGHEVHVYDRRGAEVFAPLPPPPAPEALPAPLREALAGRPARDGAANWVPIAHETRCEDCHPKAAIRGALALGPRPVGETTPDAAAVELEARLVRLAFEQIMAAKRKEDLDPFFAELALATGGRVHVAVLDVSGEVKFGKMPRAGEPLVELEVPDALLYGMPKDYGPKSWSAGGLAMRLLPLPNEERCQSCHAPDTGPLRGGLVLGVRADAGPDLVEPTLDRALRYIMLSGLGRLVIDFLDGARREAGLVMLAVYDGAGRTYHDTAVRPISTAAVKAVLDGGPGGAAYDGAGASERFVALRPLANDPECRRCHGVDHKLRGVVEIVTPTGATALEARAQMRRGVWLGVATIMVVLGLLFATTKWIVVDRVRHIGEVAESVGRGMLDTRADVRSIDEIGRLGGRINEMIRGLRERLQLQKFVSGETIAAVAGGEHVGLGGQRRRVTVFFSDIRGFTAYSERVAPERVVSMLNRYLRVQAALVKTHGGDVDKFVGDELVAVFGDAAEAVRCGIDAIDAVRALDREDGEGIAIGVGINTGEVVMGAVGHEHRMDFTVIGDAVNVGARLCSAAPRDAVLVSAAARDACASASDLEFEALAPLAVKGKAEPLAVFSAGRVASPKP